MRKVVICLILLASTLAFGQQWQTIKSMSLLQQNQPVPLTTLLTPSVPGIYRLTFYFSVGGGAGITPPGFFDATLTGRDITGLPDNLDLVLSCKQQNFESVSQVVSLKTGVPLTYIVTTSGSTGNCTYNVAITVEQLL